jgi:hypothetical protein
LATPHANVSDKENEDDSDEYSDEDFDVEEKSARAIAEANAGTFLTGIDTKNGSPDLKSATPAGSMWEAVSSTST